MSSYINRHAILTRFSPTGTKALKIAEHPQTSCRTSGLPTEPQERFCSYCARAKRAILQFILQHSLLPLLLKGGMVVFGCAMVHGSHVKPSIPAQVLLGTSNIVCQPSLKESLVRAPRLPRILAWSFFLFCSSFLRLHTQRPHSSMLDAAVAA